MCSYEEASAALPDGEYTTNSLQKYTTYSVKAEDGISVMFTWRDGTSTPSDIYVVFEK